jgi:hypothetical protein
VRGRGITLRCWRHILYWGTPLQSSQRYNASHSSAGHDEPLTRHALCIMSGLSLPILVCEALTSACSKGFHISYRINRASYGRALASHALCMMSGLSLPILVCEAFTSAPYALCIESGLSLLKVGIIVAQSRDYRCPYFFCEALTSACYKDFRASYRIMQT